MPWAMARDLVVLLAVHWPVYGQKAKPTKHNVNG